MSPIALFFTVIGVAWTARRFVCWVDKRRGSGNTYVMIYNKSSAPQEVRYLQRWCNNRLIFRAQPDFSKYDPKRG